MLQSYKVNQSDLSGFSAFDVNFTSVKWFGLDFWGGSGSSPVGLTEVRIANLCGMKSGAGVERRKTTFFRR